MPIDAAPSWSVLLFTLAISVLTGVLFGIAPAWMTSHADPVEALRGREPFGGRPSLLGAEVAGDCAGCDVTRAAVRGGSSGPEPAQPGAPEFRL